MRVLLLVLVALGWSLPGLAADDKKVWADPDEAASENPDFALQGEYVGTADIDGPHKFGVQVIALGDGKFQATAFAGGLPGAGAKLETRTVVQGQRDGDVVRFENQLADASLTEGKITVMSKDGQKTIGTAEKVERSSPRLGAEPPEGAIVLYGGPEDVDNFKGGRVTEDGLLMEGITSKQLFEGDHKLHIEFRLPYMPYARGQGRGNSGFYAQGCYEVQMLDSFGLEGKDNECGGIYTVKSPDVNMCLPPLVWQTYDIEFTAAQYDDQGNKTENARMTVYHNGVKIHDNVEVPVATRASPMKEGPEGGPVYLQNHGNPVRYKNIWVVPAAG